jgi:hypothetical protein
MPAKTISLGAKDRLTDLFSYPNIHGSDESLADTIAHWFRQTLNRDGLENAGATATVRVEGETFYLDLDGPPALAAFFDTYGKRLPKFLDAGQQALTVIPQLQAQGKWDPQKTGKWRFFLPLGLAMLNQRCLQFFHYPPIRLLDPMRDYLNDPVPVRWTELLRANQIPTDEATWLYQTVIDATPIAAPDDQGSAPGGDKTWGLIPIQYFPDYQRAMVSLLLNRAPGKAGYTIPVVVYGAHPRDIFEKLYNVKLGVNVVATAEIIPGTKTAVLGANHPYVFYGVAQSFATVGSGEILPLNAQQIADTIIKDLVVARWQVLMARDPSRDPRAVLDECNAYWADPERNGDICSLILHQGSLYYPDQNSLQFRYRWTLEQARSICYPNWPVASRT